MKGITYERFAEQVCESIASSYDAKGEKPLANLDALVILCRKALQDAGATDVQDDVMREALRIARDKHPTLSGILTQEEYFASLEK